MKWQWEKYIKIDPKFASILTKMLADTPKNRYQSAEEVLTALNGELSPTPISSAPTYTPTTIQPKDFHQFWYAQINGYRSQN